ncbi:MAG: glycyl-radical enzyme activating protein [Eubacteriales bacterium]|nr:glycyl-radical enzyme activating protein [Eubacteriales bacterium]
MSNKGTVFDIKQLAVFDGPGARTTVFLKGCPLHCMWCHNPEGLSPEPQLMVSKNNCMLCGKCTTVCPSPDNCILCGACIKVCPNNLRKICGVRYTPEELAGILLKDRDYLEMLGGGVTFSGGEPTMQAEFVLETTGLLKGMHCAIETCGFCSADTFRRIIDAMDYIMMDLKMIDPVLHKKYTGVDNAPILLNLELLKASGKPFRIRIPVIPGVNDSEENFTATAKLLQGCETLEKVELLPYHKTAGAKYSMVEMEYAPEFDIHAQLNLDTELFESFGIRCSRL